MSIKTKRGDLLEMAADGEFDVIIHGCNCFHTMGAGIAKQIARRWPQALQADLETDYGSLDKLGSCSLAIVKNDILSPLVIVNAYTQHGYGHAINLNYAALECCLNWAATNFHGRRFGLPKIGAGLAGGEWDEIREIIERAMGNEDVTIVEYSGG